MVFDKQNMFFDTSEDGFCQGIFLVSIAEVFTLYKRMCPLWECFGSSWGELGEWVGSDVLGSSWGVGWEHAGR